MPRLVVEKGKDKGKILSLRESSPYLVGRDLKTHLRLRDQQVSRRHLKIVSVGGEVRLEDLDSSNGTFVNGERVRSLGLKPGDKIQVGETLIFYLEEESVDEVVAVAPATAGTETAPAAAPVPVPEASTQEKVRRGELTGRELTGYRIGRLLGRGGMGTVYEAVQVSLERRVAFKVLARELAADGQFVDRFTAEARAAAQLNHPNIVQVYDVGTAGPSAAPIRFYSMEFMAQGSVEDLLRKEGKLPLERTLPIIFDAARGLEYAEKHGVVHRDIKPDNLMISEDGVVKIGDLGIATRRRTAEEASKEDGVSGSPHYIAPEQAMGRAIDQRADLYALGVSMYQMLAGDTPFDGASAREVILKHLNETPPPLKDKCPDLPPEVIALVERLMEKDPTRRLASASILLQELVPLIKRYPLANTSKLRIDGIIAQRTELQLAASESRPPLPDTVPRAAPSAEATSVSKDTSALEPVRRTVPVSRAALVRLVVVLGSLALGVIAFKVARHVKEGAESAREVRMATLAGLRALIPTDPFTAESKAMAASLDFERRSFSVEAKLASDIAKEAGREIARLEEEKKAKLAQEAYDDAQKKIEAESEKDRTPEKIPSLTFAVNAWGDIAEKFPGSVPGDAAAKNRETARGRLAEAQKRSEARLRDEAATRAALKQLTESLRTIFAEKRYDHAKLLIDNFERTHGGSESGAKLAGELRKDLLAQGRAEVDEARRKAGEHAGRREWDKAKMLLRDTKLLVAGISVLEEALDAELTKVGETERKEREGELTRQDREKARVAEENARKPIEDRRFDDAAQHYADAALRMRGSPALQKDLERRAERLRLAAGAIKDIVATVRAKRGASGVTHDGAAAEDATGSKLTFKGPPGGKPVDVTFAAVRADELHKWARQAAGPRAEVDELLRAAALAIETGAKELARGDLTAASDVGGFSDVQKERHDALLRAALE